MQKKGCMNEKNEPKYKIGDTLYRVSEFSWLITACVISNVKRGGSWSYWIYDATDGERGMVERNLYIDFDSAAEVLLNWFKDYIVKQKESQYLSRKKQLELFQEVGNDNLKV